MVNDGKNYRLLGRTGFKVFPLGFGTAEIGFAYGIGPRDLPSEKEAIDLLKIAVDIGINYFDTARAYDLAEKRIGKSGITRIDGVVVGTKCAQFLEKGEKLSRSEMERRIRGEVAASLGNLRLDVLPLVYLHGGTREDIEKGDVFEILQKLRSEGKIRYTGISLRGEENALAAVDCDFFDVIQVAHSILDQRMVNTVLPYAKRRNIGVTNRSVFLKGTLTPLRVYLPQELNPLKANSEKAALIAYKLGIDLPALAIRFAISNPNIGTALIGTNKSNNLVLANKAVQAGPLPNDVLEELSRLAINEASQVDPKEWPVSVGGHKKN